MQLPRPYDVGADITHLARVRPIGMAIETGLRRAAGAEGAPSDPFPARYGSVVRRLSTKPPSVGVKPPRIRV